MKKILVLLILGMFLSCSEQYDEEYVQFDPTGGETVADGLAWYDVMSPFTYSPSDGGVGGTRVRLMEGHDELEEDKKDSIALIEFDDKNNKVGMARNKVVEGARDELVSYMFSINRGYRIKVKKGDITQEQFEYAMNYTIPVNGSYIWVSNDYGDDFDVHSMPAKETVAIGTTMAVLEVYDGDDSNMDNLLGTFHLVL